MLGRNNKELYLDIIKLYEAEGAAERLRAEYKKEVILPATKKLKNEIEIALQTEELKKEIPNDQVRSILLDTIIEAFEKTFEKNSGDLINVDPGELFIDALGEAAETLRKTMVEKQLAIEPQQNSLDPTIKESLTDTQLAINKIQTIANMRTDPIKGMLNTKLGESIAENQAKRTQYLDARADTKTKKEQATAFFRTKYGHRTSNSQSDKLINYFMGLNKVPSYINKENLTTFLLNSADQLKLLNNPKFMEVLIGPRKSHSQTYQSKKYKNITFSDPDDKTHQSKTYKNYTFSNPEEKETPVNNTDIQRQKWEEFKARISHGRKSAFNEIDRFYNEYMYGTQIAYKKDKLTALWTELQRHAEFKPQTQSYVTKNDSVNSNQGKRKKAISELYQKIIKDIDLNAAAATSKSNQEISADIESFHQLLIDQISETTSRNPFRKWKLKQLSEKLYSTLKDYHLDVQILTHNVASANIVNENSGQGSYTLFSPKKVQNQTVGLNRTEASDKNEKEENRATRPKL